MRRCSRAAKQMFFFAQEFRKKSREFRKNVDAVPGSLPAPTTQIFREPGSRCQPGEKAMAEREQLCREQQAAHQDSSEIETRTLRRSPGAADAVPAYGRRNIDNLPSLNPGPPANFDVFVPEGQTIVESSQAIEKRAPYEHARRRGHEDRGRPARGLRIKVKSGHKFRGRGLHGRDTGEARGQVAGSGAIPVELHAVGGKYRVVIPQCFHERGNEVAVKPHVIVYEKQEIAESQGGAAIQDRSE